MAYACTDELHQLFVPGRAGMVTDVLIDSTGAALITGLLWIVGRRREGTSGEDGTVWAAGRPEDRSRRFLGPDSRVKQMGPGERPSPRSMWSRPWPSVPSASGRSGSGSLRPCASFHTLPPAAVPGYFWAARSPILGGAAALDVVFGVLQR